MFVSFFPAPRAFFWSAAVWTLVAVLFWFFVARDLGHVVGLENPPEDAQPIIGVSVFWSKPFLWFGLYYFVAFVLFAAFWRIVSPQPWFWWSIPGSALIIFIVYFQVQVSVAINDWYLPFYDLIQRALSKPETGNVVSVTELYFGLLSFAEIAFVAVTVGTLNRFFVQHFIFRWRTAMNNYYMENWSKFRTVEGAAQRVQEDTMRFAQIMEGLGVRLIDAVMTLIAFLPVLLKLSSHVTELPVIGSIPYPLLVMGLAWSVFGTLFLLAIGIRLPGLYFRNQRVEAAYRKELVYGEDNANRALPPTVSELFSAVRHNYFRLYFNYLYFNLGSIVYGQADVIFPYIILAPTIAVGKISFGIFQQITNAFGQVRDSFQFLVNSWSTIVELQSIHKRLRAFEAVLHEEPLADIEKEWKPQKA